MDKMQFEFSDLIAGYVTDFNEKKNEFKIKTSRGNEFLIKIAANIFGRILSNLNEGVRYIGEDQIRDLLNPGQYLFAYGIFYPQAGKHVFEAKIIDFPGTKPGKYRFEEPDWWINQAKSISNFFIHSQFGGSDKINFRNYRTELKITGEHEESYIQETDTISRLVYGFASTYLLTGEDIYLEAAEKGTAYLREHMRFYDVDENIVYWYHGINVMGDKEKKLYGSEFNDDEDTIPAYEQIYAIAGPTQTYRINGDPKILKDIKMTIDLFDKYFFDKEKGGYFSHIDPITLDPRADSLKWNKARKNWNSVGDHAPAYLINLCLATGNQKYIDFLKYTADCIEKYFQDYANSPFVQEKFFEDWSHDYEWRWQQDRGVIGHNYKIAWNLMRINSITPDKKYVEFAEKIANVMCDAGFDRQRSGIYDVMERKLGPGEEVHRFAWHDRKAWWQQEQGILAYQILYGILGKQEYLKYARELTAFYNSFFLDHQDGGIYFNVLANGIPYLMGTERQKGSHSMSGYHSIELAYLAAVYTNLLNTKKGLDLYFKPMVNAFPDNIIRVSPDILPAGSVKIEGVWVDGDVWKNFDPENLTVAVPNVDYRPKIKVRIVALEK
jgi:mannose/cellobiose epimerase-like protein (N-acyl-D-glucosamine 2-epimerase family)